jgi:hypothetical protein
MIDQSRTARRIGLLRDLVVFHERRESEATAFGETPSARYHRERAEKLRFVISTIERDDRV